MYLIINVHQYPRGLDEGARYLHDKWGDDGNYLFIAMWCSSRRPVVAACRNSFG